MEFCCVVAGDNISVTGGVVSRVDFQQVAFSFLVWLCFNPQPYQLLDGQQYAHGAANLLAVQIDAAINPGNSGGPAMLDGRVVGKLLSA